ncbi:hypothetical protein DFP73DRAFT_622252 [Morchella snyderi]|nr:hypothetical protein DFP73DRAFT_622252 [Morchella snyderi]
MPPDRQPARPPAEVDALTDTKTAQEVRQAAERAAAFLAQRNLHTQPTSNINAANGAENLHTSFEFASLSEYEASFPARVINEMIERGQIDPEWRELARNRAIQNVLNRGSFVENGPTPPSTSGNNSSRAKASRAPMKSGSNHSATTSMSSGGPGLLQHLERSTVSAESDTPRTARSTSVRGRARRAALPRAGRYANSSRTSAVQGPKMEPFDPEKSREELARCLGVYMDNVMPGVNPSSLSAADMTRLINDMEQMMIAGTAFPNGPSAYSTTSVGSSGGPGGGGQGVTLSDELPPVEWGMSTERYKWLIAYMKRYMPLDTPATISEDERVEIMLAFDRAMVTGSLDVDVPDVKLGEGIAQQSTDKTIQAVWEHMKRSNIKSHSANVNNLPYPVKAYTEEDLSRLARVSYDIAMKRVREAGGPQNALNQGDDSYDKLKSDIDQHQCSISETLHQVLLEQVTHFLEDSKVDTQKPGLLTDENSIPTKSNLTFPGPLTTRKAVTRPRGGRGGGRVTGNELHQGRAQHADNPDLYIPAVSKMAPDASTMTEDKRETLASYMERTKSMKTPSGQRRNKRGKPGQIQDEKKTPIPDELPVCTNPHCQCNQPLPLEESASEVGGASGSKLYEPPTSSNGADYGSESGASSPACFKETFEEALLATSAFSERVKVPPRNQRPTTHMSGVDELLAKAQMLEHDQCLLQAEKPGKDGLASDIHQQERPETPLDNQITEPDQMLTEDKKAELDMLVKKYLNCTLEPESVGAVVGHHHRQSTISSSLKERDRLFHALDELNALPPKPACTRKARPKGEKVSACGATNSEIYSGFRAVVAEQFKVPSKNSEDGPGLNLPAFLLPGLYDYVMNQKTDSAPAPKPRRRRNKYKTVVAPIPADLKREIDNWEVEFKESGIPEEDYMKWMTGRYNSYCKGLAKLQQLVTDMKLGPSSPEINHILKTAQRATGVAADTYLLKSNAEDASFPGTPTRKK